MNARSENQEMSITSAAVKKIKARTESQIMSILLAICLSPAFLSFSKLMLPSPFLSVKMGKN